MTIDWNSFTPVSAAVGGLLIGVAAAILVLLQGRIAGISGVAVQLGSVQLKGMALATVVGMLLSLAFHLLDRLGLTNEPIEP